MGRPLLFAVLGAVAGWLVRWLRSRHAEATVAEARKPEPPPRNAGPKKNRPVSGPPFA